ncbi:MAG: helix-turn-helix domain-containing protein [Puniceicoccaceae bacterium]
MSHDKTFFQNLGISWFRVWENVPNVHFFIKDLDGRIMACNQRFAKLMGGTCEEDILHKTAFDLCSRDLAIRYTEDDQRVFAGEEILDRYEPNVGEEQGRYWYLTTKLPVHDPNGNIVGLIGLTRVISSFSDFAEEMKPVLDYIHTSYATRINFVKLAKSVNMSISKLERRFKHYFGISPLQYSMRQRVIIAAEYLLRTNLTIAEIAVQVGFYDQTTLTRHFRKHKGTTPLKYRKRYS